jgi:hypothetical protein
MVVTLICFIISLILFFLYAIADYPNTIIYDKVDLIIEYSKHDEKFRQKLISNVNSYYTTRDVNGIEDSKKERDEHNTEYLHKTGVLPYLYAVIFLGICLLIFSFTSNRTGHLEKCDIVLVFLAISAFVVEVIFYFILLANWKYITDTEVMKSMI